MNPFNDRIQHIIVLMFENRSFDHMLGFLNHKGHEPGKPKSSTSLAGAPRGWTVPENLTDPNSARRKFTPDASFALDKGPAHEFEDIREQLENKNSGFVANFQRYHSHHPWSVMEGFSTERLPVLSTLAKQYAVCDHWFSSLPGPTWPNRFFIHAATSGGLVDSPTLFQKLGTSMGIDKFYFKNKTIYNHLSENSISWSIYHDGDIPQSESLGDVDFNGNNRKSLRQFYRELRKADPKNPDSFPKYSYIEPYYDVLPVIDPLRDLMSGTRANDEHPPKDIRHGELLLKQIYTAIRKSPIWEQTLFVVVYDENGGFADHVVPPISGAYPTGDDQRYLRLVQKKRTFDFRRLGFRVPAVLISPYIAAGTIDHTVYDHTSLLRTVEKRFGLDPLTHRDANANSFEKVFVDNCRKDNPVIPDPYGYKGWNRFEDDPLSQQNLEPIDPLTHSFLHLAVSKGVFNSKELKKVLRTKTSREAHLHWRTAHKRINPKSWLHEVRRWVRTLILRTLDWI